MGALILPNRFNQQPQQATRVQSQGLIHLWALNAMGDRAILDSAGLANGSFGVGTGGATGNSWLLGRQGYFVNFDNSGTGSVNSVVLPVGNSGGSGSPGSNIFTIQARIQIGVAATNQTIYGAFDTGLQFRVNSSNQLQLLKAGVAAIGNSTGTLTAGVDYDVAVTYNGSTAVFYINGIASGSATSAQTFVLNTQYAIGNKGGSTAVEPLTNGSRVYYLGIWNRVRVISEIAEHARNPWQVFQATPRRLWGIASSSPDVTLGLTGQALTGSAGTLPVSRTAALTGSAATASRGTVTPSASKAVAGQSSSTSAGVVAPSSAKALTGQSATAAQGSATAAGSANANLSGASAAISQGTAKAAITVALTGQQVSAQSGNVGTSGNKTVALSGQAITASRGSIAAVVSGAAPDGAYAATIMRANAVNAQVTALIASIAAQAGTMSSTRNCATVMRAVETNKAGAMRSDAINRTVEFI